MKEIIKIKTVMTVDDNSIDQILYKRIMNRSGLVDNIISFQYADDALQYLKSDDSEKIDVIFLDINMPRMSGLEFLERMSNDFGPEFSSLVVIMLTTSLDPEDERRAQQYKAVKAYMRKPLKVEDLATVSHLLPQ